MTPISLQPTQRVTLHMPLEFAPDRTEQENALMLYRAWVAALEEWNQKVQQNLIPEAAPAYIPCTWASDIQHAPKQKAHHMLDKIKHWWFTRVLGVTSPGSATATTTQPHTSSVQSQTASAPPPSMPVMVMGEEIPSVNQPKKARKPRAPRKTTVSGEPQVVSPKPTKTKTPKANTELTTPTKRKSRMRPPSQA